MHTAAAIALALGPVWLLAALLAVAFVVGTTLPRSE